MNQDGETKNCSDCGGVLQDGYVPDYAHAKIMQPRWEEGRPERRWIGGVKVSKDTPKHVSAWRCADCGLLKFYAL